MDFYCVKCKQHREAKTFKTITSKNGRKMATAECPTCGSKMTKFLKK